MRFRLDIAASKLDGFRLSAERLGSKKLHSIFGKLESAIENGNADKATQHVVEFNRERKNRLEASMPAILTSKATAKIKRDPLDTLREIAKTATDPDLIDKIDDVLKIKNSSAKEQAIQELDNWLLKKTKQSYMHTFDQRGDNLAKESPVFAKVFSQLQEAMDNSNGIQVYQLLETVRAKAVTITRWRLREWGCIDRTFTFEGLDRDRIIYGVGILTTRYEEKVAVQSLQQDLVKFKDKNGVAFYYTLGVKKENFRYSAAKASKELEAKPPYIRNNIGKGVIFTDRDHPLDAFFRKDYANFPKGAMYSGNPVTVHGDYTDADGDIRFIRSICHEIGHHIDVRVGWRNNIANQTAWAAAQSGDGKFYRDYGKNSPKEDFADMISLFANVDTAWIKKEFPYRYDLIKKIIDAL